MEHHRIEDLATDPMRAPAEIDYVVAPDRLCVLCHRIVKLFTDSQLWKEMNIHTDPIERQQGSECRSFFEAPVPYHATSAHLLKSAEDGCHLCSLFVTSMGFGHQGVKLAHRSKLGIQLYSESKEKASRIQPQDIRRILDELSLDENSLSEDRLRDIQRLCPEFSFDKNGQPRCQTLAMCLIHESTDENPLLAWEPQVILHRHVLNATGHKCSTDAEQNHQFKDSVDFQLQWCTDTKSSVCLKAITSWLRDCVENHDCCSFELSRIKPKRLLDLEAFSDSQDIRLILSEEMRSDTYATLSYRWGSTNHVTLNAATYDLMRSRVSICGLPKTIKDAIEVCRGLFMRYLWIDALCIIQGDSDDKSQEIANMGSIYSGSLFTLSAADSLDSDSGLFRKRGPLYRENCVLVESENIHRVMAPRTNSPGQEGTDPERSHLAKRGWVMQERLLSPRTIHFTAGDVIWECRERMNQSGATFGKPQSKQWSIPWHFGKKIVLSFCQEWAGQRNKEVFRTLWAGLLRLYSRTCLTNTDDRLSALAGIAEIASTQMNLEASYGLWLDFFIEELQWYRQDEELVLFPRPNEGPPNIPTTETLTKLREQMPSWSWASTPYPIDMEVVVDQTDVRSSAKHMALRSAVVLTYPVMTPFQQLSTLHQRAQQPVSCKIRGWLKQCQVYPTMYIAFKEGVVWWIIVPTSEELPTEIQAQIQKRWDLHHAGNRIESDSSRRIKFGAAAKTRFEPNMPPHVQENLSCLLLKRTCVLQKRVSATERSSNDRLEEGVNIVDTGLVLRLIDASKAVYERVGFFQDVINASAIHNTKDHEVEQTSDSSWGSSPTEPRDFVQTDEANNITEGQTHSQGTARIEMLLHNSEPSKATWADVVAEVSAFDESSANWVQADRIPKYANSNTSPWSIKFMKSLIDKLSLFHGDEDLRNVELV